MKTTLNGESREFAGIRTVQDLPHARGYQEKRLAVELNGDIVPKSEHPATELKDDDVLEIVIAVGGG